MTDAGRGIEPGVGRPRPRRARDAVRGLLVLLAVALGVAVILRDLQGFLDGIARIGLMKGLGAFGVTLVGVAISAEAWRLNVAAVAGPMPANTARQVFFVSQLGKYLPGALWPILAQIDAAREHGIARSRMAIASLLFLALHLLTGAIVAVGLTPWASPDLVRRYPWVFAVAPLMGAALVPAVLSRAIDMVLRLGRRDPLPTKLGWADTVRPAAVLLLTWACYGIGVAVVAAPIANAGNGARLLAVTTGAFALAWIVGLLVVAAPAGIGAREVVLVLALTPALGLTGATSVAVVVRVAHSAADLLLAGVGRLSSTMTKRPRLRRSQH